MMAATARGVESVMMTWMVTWFIFCCGGLAGQRLGIAAGAGRVHRQAVSKEGQGVEQGGGSRAGVDLGEVGWLGVDLGSLVFELCDRGQHA
jgi:hypothetical protein